MNLVTVSSLMVSLVSAGALNFGAATIAAADRDDAMKVLAGLHDNDTLGRGIESDAADRTRLADRTRMLTQRVAAAACSVATGVAVEESQFFLEESMHEMDIILDALRNGNEKLYILEPERSARILRDLDALESEWKATHPAVEAILANTDLEASAHDIIEHDAALLKLASTLSSDISGKYGNPYEVTQADAMLLELSGRQAMLTQKMAKDACEIWADDHAEEGRADLIQTMSIFEGSLVALRDGMPELGVKPAPNDAILADLNDLLERWDVLRPNLETLVAGDELAPEDKFEIVHDFNVELEAIDHLVHDYQLYAERHH